MSDAVYGLIGALGGALLTAAVAYWGPLHQQREAAKQAELQRSADMRRVEMEIEAARTQAEEARKHVEVQAAIGRLVDVRSTLRTWQSVLDGALADMRVLGTFDLDRFREEEKEAMTKGMRALDEVMHDQWYVRMSYYETAPGDDEVWQLDRSSSPNGLLVEALKAYGARIRALGLAGRPASAEDLATVSELRDQASLWRGEMSEIIQNRLEDIVTSHDLRRDSSPSRSRQTHPPS